MYVGQISNDALFTGTGIPTIHDATYIKPRLRHATRIAAPALHPLDERRWVQVAAERRTNDANRQACGWFGFMHDLQNYRTDTGWAMVMPLHSSYNVQYICGDRPPKDSPLFVSWSDLPVWTNLLNQPAFGFWPDVLPSLTASFGSERIAKSCASWCTDSIYNIRTTMHIKPICM